MVIRCNPAYHDGVVCKLYDGVSLTSEHAVVSVEGEEEGAQHTACVQCNGGGDLPPLPPQELFVISPCVSIGITLVKTKQTFPSPKLSPEKSPWK